MSAALKRGRLSARQVSKALAIFETIAIRTPDIDHGEALKLAVRARIYAYDAYVLQCARQYRAPLLTLDGRQREVAAELGISLLEV
ncbi:MAG: type II toxin-antitoxin system VapC family toxin [Rhodothermales bacterium]|nr:type II toxin-antitoxin system VapC family toxin [Rhodothermales bacterium]MBO6780049.1 type II toxin-antitoxin system VapC family toxin [Rhodothermales bacterium]